MSSTSTWPVFGTMVATAASIEKVPLPCNGTTTCEPSPCTMASRPCLISAVSAMNEVSHEPQSRSIARLVRSVVVSGPGVRRMASRSMDAVSEIKPFVGQRSVVLRQAWVRCSTHAPAAMNSKVTTVEAAVMSTAHAAAAPASPASSRLRMAMAATLVSGE